MESELRTPRFVGTSHVGCTRRSNEDSYSGNSEKGLFVVADGMGGHQAGEVASATAILQINCAMSDGAHLEEAILKAHAVIVDQSADEDLYMGTTVIAAQMNNHHYELAWVGDSRAYAWRFGGSVNALELLSHDHSLVQQLVDRGLITPEEARVHPERNIITQCLGSRDIPRIKVGKRHLSWRRNEWLILCSDGLTGELTDGQMADILLGCRTTEEATQKLLNAALLSGANDNVTVVVIESPLNQPSAFKRLQQKLKKWYHRRPNTHSLSRKLNGKRGALSSPSPLTAHVDNVDTPVFLSTDDEIEYQGHKNQRCQNQIFQGQQHSEHDTPLATPVLKVKDAGDEPLSIEPLSIEPLEVEHKVRPSDDTERDAPQSMLDKSGMLKKDHDIKTTHGARPDSNNARSNAPRRDTDDTTQHSSFPNHKH
ncbi:PP2C family protein-serine/threonine phosphatase [Marinibactrum halimedae]|uniref:PPM-type phosphatase domain-containing protein n=1 Tax=Marinibactrum halimedae TaxID=1444977 RepID=A0AA37T7Z1_9GAMM|nr:protein phosphatase 2C domain-containing protein [Marinibactrum halimedae]MCD9458499.1 protein phosphatase 2C domain-containing protein [Marinibactrum halimedae]GLS26638.1 hypothetical protein GCM10007877_23540 [Marinibactrum halimedae]